MKNKGFVFVETIVVIVILTVGLVMIYSSFSSVLTNDKRRATYNDVAYIYRTFYIEDFIVSLNLEDYIQEFLVRSGSKIVEFNCDNNLLYKIDNNTLNTGGQSDLPDSERIKKGFCETLKNDLNANKIYITNYNINEIKQCTTRSGKLLDSCKNTNSSVYTALRTMSNNMVYYLRTLSGNISNNYRLIIEYNDEVVDPDRTVSKIKRNGTSKCPDSYLENSSGICQRVIKRNYYSNIKIVLRSKL